MANNENLIPIPGRLHSVATEGHVSGADEIYDDTQQKDQATINSELIQAVGTGGSVDSKIATAKTEIIGDAATDYNTLGKLEDKIQAEATRAEETEEALDGRVDTLEDAVGTGGSVDSRISTAVATETTRAQAAEADRYTKAETYNKNELNNMVTTPNQEYVSVTATAQTTAVTDVLPATGAADTTYRVGNWDGTQYNDSVFSEYAWDGSAYIKLSTKSQVGEVYDISVNHADTKYADLAAALGTNGANVPQSLRKGGMSVKFVQSSDNKYIQFRCAADEFTTDTTQWAISDEGVYVENPEFIYVKTDAEDKILWAIKTDGSIYYGAGVPQQVVDYINEKIAELSLDEYEDIVAFLNGLEKGYKTLQTLLNEKVDKEEGKSLIDAEYASSQSAIDNPEYLAAWVDAEDKIIFGLKADGKTYVGDADFLNDIDDIKTFLQSITDKNIDWDALSSITAVENPEFIEAKTDSEGKLLAGRTPDGAAFENVGFSTPKVSTESVDIDGHIIKNIEDPEGRSEVTTDSEGKIISYRDSEGVKHEEVGIETSKLTLSDSGMTEFQKALKKNGFAANDWSDYISEDGDKPLLLPEPRCAYVNFTGSPLPTTKINDYHAYIEYHDNMGNYFKKKVILNAQGSSSISYNNQKNLSIDLFDSEWDGDSFAVKIGNWVPQDSFHIKTFYMDPIRGLADVCYKYAEYVIQETNTRPNRLAREEEKVTVNGDTGIISNDYDTGALCHPDGFPCLVYHEGEFMGIYAWNLKKHRKNYMMDKNDYESVHIDPAYSNLCNLNPIAWDKMEIRNPKTLICMDGSKYDGDNPKELIDSTSEYWNNSKDQKNTVKTKNIIVGLHDTVAAINNAPTQEEKKALFSQHFDVDAYITFWLVSQFTDNWDGMRDRNTQWLYYKKSGKWCPSFYDLDNIIGYAGYPWIDSPATTFAKKEFAYAENRTTHWLWLFFQAEIVEKYNELKQKKIISSEAFMKFYNDWYERIGTEYIALNAEMWDVPCYRDGKVNKEYWKQTGIVLGNTVTYDETTNYQIGDTVTYGNGEYITGPYVVQFECIKACTGELPCGSYPNMPQTGGVFDSPRRIKAWLDAKIEILDGLIVNN